MTIRLGAYSVSGQLAQGGLVHFACVFAGGLRYDSAELYAGARCRDQT